MNKNFTKDDIIKKHETNVKSATSGFMLAGILGIVYILRFFITKGFDFFFSLTATELVLRLEESGSVNNAAALVIIAVYVGAYTVIAALTAKKPEWLRAALGLYLIDTLCFIPLFIFHGDIRPEYFIDVIVHIFVIVFLAVGIKSSNQLQKEKA